MEPRGAGPAPLTPPPARSFGLLALQRSAGNRAVAELVRPVVQRCGSTPPDQCGCHDDEPVVARDGPDGAGGAAPAPAAEPAGADLSAKLHRLAADLRAIGGYAAGKAAADGMDGEATAYVGGLNALVANIETTATGTDEAAKAAVLREFGPGFVGRAEAVASGKLAEVGDDVAEMATDVPVTQRLRATESVPAASREPARPVQRQVAETLVIVGSGMVGTAEAAAPVEVATGPPGWVTGAVLLVAGAALIGIGVYMASNGNVADTGIMEEARAMVAAGTASDICDALAKLMASTSDSRRKLRIKATQKAMGCRHSRHS